MRFYCKRYQGHELTQVCMYFSPGFEYSCLSKKSPLKMCPWNGKPWAQPTGYFLGEKDFIPQIMGVGETTEV